MFLSNLELTNFYFLLIISLHISQACLQSKLMSYLKKTVVMYVVSTDKLTELERQLNCFFHDACENQIVSHIAVQVPHIDLIDDNNKGIVVHYPNILKDDNDVSVIFSWMVSEE
jgi:predicted nucleic acid-binding protein